MGHLILASSALETPQASVMVESRPAKLHQS
jgi:hypothetical protein